jgi:hypothetical protein
LRVFVLERETLGGLLTKHEERNKWNQESHKRKMLEDNLNFEVVAK